MTRKIDYKKAGVDIDKANLLVTRIKSLSDKISTENIIQGIGPFAGGYLLKEFKKYCAPVLVATCDGVGTKLRILSYLGKYEVAGVDLVAMNVNDLITCGAKPLFFLDYLAMGKLELSIAQRIIKGIIQACKQCNIALLGGETAEMPGFYKKGDFELAGFALGIVEKNKMITGKDIKPGDLILGLNSNGLHANGFSLVRKLFSKEEIRERWGREFSRPTKIYLATISKLLGKIRLKAIAHITGGGFYDNILRVLPANCSAQIKYGSWRIPAIFKEIEKRANLSREEMFRTFNMGIGMILILAPRDILQAERVLKELNVKHYQIGFVKKGKREVLLI